jgi:cytochrome c peroxidase
MTAVALDVTLSKVTFDRTVQSEDQMRKQFRQRVLAPRALAFAIPVALVIAGSFGARLGAQAGESGASQVDTGRHHDDDGRNDDYRDQGRRLFERDKFGGNGRTCLTCHTRETGTISPADAQERFSRNPNDPLFDGDGSDDGAGGGAQRMLKDATVLVRVPLAANVSLAADPAARSVVLRRGIPSTINTPSLDPILMVDGRFGSLEAQARGAIADHAQGKETPTAKQLEQIAVFERTQPFFSSYSLENLAFTGRAPGLPRGRTDAEKRGRRFFEDVPLGPGNSKEGTCALCHSGPMLNETNQFFPAPPFGRGGRFQTILVSELNEAGNPVIDFLFKNTDGTTTMVSSPDPGRALITGSLSSPDSLNAFKISSLWGVANTAPYFHDNSAKTLEDVVRHYAKFFEIISNPGADGDPTIELTAEDQADIVAYLKLLR